MPADVAVLGSVHLLDDNSVIVDKVKKCQREMSYFPLVFQTRYQEFHKKYDGRKTLCGKCPHRNFPLENLKTDDYGFVICNGHGLKIDTRNNCVVSRFEK